MEKENDYFYRNKFERFQHTKSFVKMFLYQILNPEDLSNIKQEYSLL